MKKLLLSFMAILLICGIAHAVSIPQSEEPTNGPYIWFQSVYNNSGAELDVGDVVVWDISNSTGDNDNYVTTTSTLGTGLVAGVVYPSNIGIASSGTIAIRGVVTCDTALAVVDGAKMCSGGVAGGASPCNQDNDEMSFAIATAAISAASSGTCYVTLGR